MEKTFKEKTEKGCMVYYQEPTSGHIKSYWVEERLDRFKIRLSDSNLNKIIVSRNDIMFDVDNHTYLLSYKNDILKEYNDIKNIISEHKDSFLKLSEKFDSHNFDEEDGYFDINTDLGVWTIYNVGYNGYTEIGVLTDFEMYGNNDSIGVYNINHCFGDTMDKLHFGNLHWMGKKIAIEQGFNWKENALSLIKLHFPKDKESDMMFYIDEYWNNLDTNFGNLSDYDYWRRTYLIK